MKDHYFIAAAIPTDAKQELYQMSKVIQKYGSCKSFVHPQDYHLTLLFLGDVGFSQLQALKKELPIIAANQKEIPMQINGINVFGNEKSPRIIYADVIVYNRLLQMQRQITSLCEKLDLSFDKKSFRAHITLARRWLEDNSFPMENLHEDIIKLNQTPFSIQHIVLYKTHQNRLPKYQPIGIYPLTP